MAKKRAREQDSWVAVTRDERLATEMMEGSERFRREFREGWSCRNPEKLIGIASYAGVRFRSLCSDRTRRYCSKEGRCNLRLKYWEDGSKDTSTEKFERCQRYCLQAEFTVVDRPKELKTRAKKVKSEKEAVTA